MSAHDNPALGYKSCGKCGDYGIRFVINDDVSPQAFEYETVHWCKCPRGLFAQNHWLQGVAEQEDRRNRRTGS